MKTTIADLTALRARHCASTAFRLPMLAHVRVPGLGQLLALLTTLALVSACATENEPPSAATDANGSLLSMFDNGDFLPDGWLDIPELDRLGKARERLFVPAWLLAFDDGWSRPESWGVFALGSRASLDLHLLSTDARDLVVDCGPPEIPEAKPQTVDVQVNGQPAGSFEVPDSGWRRFRLPVASAQLRTGLNRVELAFSHHYDLGDRDQRPLALGVQRIGLVPTGAEPDGDDVPANRARPPYKIDHARDAVYLTRAGTFLVAYDVPAAGASWTFEARAAGWTTPGERLSVRAITMDGQHHELASVDTDGIVTLDLSRFAGRRLTLAFASRPPAEARLELRAPRIAGPEPGQQAAASAKAGSQAADEGTEGDSQEHDATAKRPHVLLVILDALRTDHVGAYGYPRDTTPRIDALANEGVAFRNIVAECPYTICSSPSFLTGLPFTEHGVVDLGQRIRDDTETLAERLFSLGYETIGVSGNPNNSNATGSARGFSEYYESWHIFHGKERERERWHPETLTDIVISRLSKGFEGKPSLVMAHYVPPHEPYAPDPEFDRFGDPGYDGPVTSDKHQTREIFGGHITLDEADREELIALYDGNLLQADHHLGRLFDAYREAGLWDDTLVIVTSDHGEGFGEHEDLYGHNKTLFRTMIDVPLVIRPPAETTVGQADPERFASLASIPPTIFGVLGEAPGPGVVGSDLLARRPDAAPSAADPTAMPREERLVVQRTAHADNPFYGLRSERFLATVRARRAAALHDHATDPAQQREVSADHPFFWTGLVLRIERALAERRESQAGALNEEDRKMLESLGYTGG